MSLALLKGLRIVILDRVSEPNNRRPKSGLSPKEYGTEKRPFKGHGPRSAAPGGRPFRGKEGPQRSVPGSRPFRSDEPRSAASGSHSHDREEQHRSAPGARPFYGEKTAIHDPDPRRPFRGKDPRSGDTHGYTGTPRPNRDTSEAPRKQPYESPWKERGDASPNDPIVEYISEHKSGKTEAGKSRFVSPFVIPEDVTQDLAAFLSAVAEILPVQDSRRRLLKGDVLDLWRDLTSERSMRSADYMGKPASLAAYIRYFMAWNVVRLVPVLASLPLDPPKGAKILDIGSGPLTLPIALWIARPDLRDRGLRIVCTDRVRKALDSGASILDSLRLKTGGPLLGEEAWKIETRRAVFPDMGGPIRADVVTSANAFTEFFWKSGRKESTLGEKAALLVADLESACKPGGTIILVEPGEPRSGTMLAAMREAALLAGHKAISPCPHARACPMAGSFGGMGDREDGRAHSALPPVHMPHWRPKMPWCHFPVPLTIAPQGLVRFSEEVGLPKDRLTVSWLALETGIPTDKKPETEQKGPLKVRLISDPIALPGGWDGRYSCSDLGYTLVVGPAAKEAAGSVLELDRPARNIRDDKSGAVLIGP
jgi:hypothetical protein